MTKQEINTKTLNERLLKFAGFKKQPTYCTDGTKLWEWVDSKNDFQFFDEDKPDLVNLLDAQFKYLWPELRKRGYMIRYQYSQILDEDFNLIWDWAYYCHIYYVDAKHPKPLFTQHEFKAINKDSPALACALAIDQLINSLNKEQQNA